MSTLAAPPVEALTNPAAVLAESKAIRPRGRYTPQQISAMKEAADLFGAACGGGLRARANFQEALSRSDFQYIFGNVLDKELMERYPGLPKVWPDFATKAVVPDFKAKKWVDLLGGRGRLSVVPELTEYPHRTKSDQEFSLSVTKYGDKFSISWESIVNDDLDALRTLPDDLAVAASETEDYVATGQLVASTGPDTTFFSAGHGNLLTGNAALTVDSLSTALTQVSTRRDEDGRPMAISSYVLMVPPALEIQALKITEANEIRITSGSNEIISTNWLRGKVKVVVNHWIPTIDVSANAATTWYLLPAPATRRPAVVMGFLRGHEMPDLRVNNVTGQRVGGGAVSPEDGSFDLDDIQYRVRHILGAAQIEWRASLVSNGSGV